MRAEHRDRSPSDDPRLTRLLAGWADARRLTGRQAEAIRRQIVAEPVTGQFDWWWHLLSPSDGSAFRGLTGVPGWETVAAAYAPASQQTALWSTGASIMPAWEQDADDFQPYLRLT